ncbi:BrnT family toxin [Aureimonas glaciei]|uniref:BrnT family toxin n=1 Tax=Aureimonas glaciei TaxID=1776957 RepID=UPI001662FB7B|nr:BrnT family toxin [Aureimonas glaciei]
MKMVWGDRKRRANLEKHGMDFAAIDVHFFIRAAIVPARNGRLIAIADLDGPTTVVFAPLGAEAVSIISMRPASRGERRLL